MYQNWNHGGRTTEYFTSTYIKKATKANIKAVLISGERDYRYQKETHSITAQFKKFGLKHQLIVIENLGHSVPENFSKLLDSYIEYLRD